LTGALKESSRWRVVYDDGVALVFRQKTGGETVSAAAGMDESKGLPTRVVGGGSGRGREATKTQASDQSTRRNKSKT
jgi:hypothetical protein